MHTNSRQLRDGGDFSSVDVGTLYICEEVTYTRACICEKNYETSYYVPVIMCRLYEGRVSNYHRYCAQLNDEGNRIFPQKKKGKRNRSVTGIIDATIDMYK